MGRPREHDERTRAALTVAAERLVARGGPDALSLRMVAEEVDTTTRAVYSLFGSKEGLIASLAERAFEVLSAAMDDLPMTRDPAGDLVAVGVTVFRTFVREHPSLYRIAFQRIVPDLLSRPEVAAARAKALPRLAQRVQRVKDAGLLGKKSVAQATMEYNAMCEGLANAELRGRTLPLLPEGEEEEAWREALTTLVRGFAASPAKRASKRPPSG